MPHLSALFAFARLTPELLEIPRNLIYIPCRRVFSIFEPFVAIDTNAYGAPLVS